MGRDPLFSLMLMWKALNLAVASTLQKIAWIQHKVKKIGSYSVALIRENQQMCNFV